MNRSIEIFLLVFVDLIYILPVQKDKYQYFNYYTFIFDDYTLVVVARTFDYS